MPSASFRLRRRGRLRDELSQTVPGLELAVSVAFGILDGHVDPSGYLDGDCGLPIVDGEYATNQFVHSSAMGAGLPCAMPLLLGLWIRLRIAPLSILCLVWSNH